MDTFWNYTLPYNGSDNPCGLFCLICWCDSFQASATDEAIALLLFEWAVSKYRVGKFRALAVAILLQRRQAEITEEVRLQS